MVGRILGLLATACTWGLLGTATVFAQTEACGPLHNHYGPYDYRTDKDKLAVVERFHFTGPVEAGLRGSTTTDAGGDLAYTLSAFPNHHRALLALMRYAERKKSSNPPGMAYSVECYFERAIRFRRDDIVARMLYAQYLIKSGREKDAAKEVQTVEDLAGNSAFGHYYAGMLYFDLKNYDRSLAQAYKAADLGHDISELRELLKKAGQWKDPPTAAASTDTSSAGSETPSKP